MVVVVVCGIFCRCGLASGMMSAEDACYQTQGVLLYLIHSCRLCNHLAGAEALLNVMTPLMVECCALKLSMAALSRGIVLFDTIVSFGRSFTAPMTRSEEKAWLYTFYLLSPKTSILLLLTQSPLSLFLPFFPDREEWSCTTYNVDNSVTHRFLVLFYLPVRATRYSTLGE